MGTVRVWLGREWAWGEGGFGNVWNSTISCVQHRRRTLEGRMTRLLGEWRLLTLFSLQVVLVSEELGFLYEVKRMKHESGTSRRSPVLKSTLKAGRQTCFRG